MILISDSTSIQNSKRIQRANSKTAGIILWELKEGQNGLDWAGLGLKEREKKRERERQQNREKRERRERLSWERR